MPLPYGQTPKGSRLAKIGMNCRKRRMNCITDPEAPYAGLILIVEDDRYILTGRHDDDFGIWG